MINPDKIVNFYENNDDLLCKDRKTVPEGVALFVPENCVFFNSNPGLGDVLSVFHLPKFFEEHGFKSYVHSSNVEYFNALSKYNKDIKPLIDDCNGIRVEHFQAFFNFGGGHFFQKIQKACGFEIDLRPKPDLSFAPEKQRRTRVAVNFEPGRHVEEQRKNIHPRAREVYPEHRETIQKFISDYSNTYDFIEIGANRCGWLESVENKCGLPLNESFEELAACEYFLGIHSGVMHLAAALDIKSIIILNFPSAKQLYLPSLKDYDLPDLDWLYPQNVHLHEDDEGELVKLLTYNNLDKAFHGDLYPYWSDKYLELVSKR
jgi:hypothetical protein